MLMALLVISMLARKSVIQLALLLVASYGFHGGYACVDDGTHLYVAGNAKLLVDANVDGFEQNHGGRSRQLDYGNAGHAVAAYFLIPTF
jgi:hypothetical protein